jgi:hypothetical protein
MPAAASAHVVFQDGGAEIDVDPPVAGTTLPLRFGPERR